MWTKTEEGTNKGTCHSQWPERIRTASDEVENNLFSGDEKKGKLTVFQLHLQHKLLLSEKLTVYIAQKQSSLKFTRLYCECRCVFLQKFPSATKSIKKNHYVVSTGQFPLLYSTFCNIYLFSHFISSRPSNHFTSLLLERVGPRSFFGCFFLKLDQEPNQQTKNQTWVLLSRWHWLNISSGRSESSGSVN